MQWATSLSARLLCLGPAFDGDGKKNKWYSVYEQCLILLTNHPGLLFLTHLPPPPAQSPASHIQFIAKWTQKHSSSPPCFFSSLPLPWSMPWLSLGQMLSHGHLTGLLASFLLLVSLVSTEQAKSTFENRCIVHFPILKFLGAPPHVLRLTSELTVAHGLSRLVLHHSYLSRAALSHPRVSAHTSLPQGSTVHGLLSAVTSPSWFSVISPFIMIFNPILFLKIIIVIIMIVTRWNSSC